MQREGEQEDPGGRWAAEEAHCGSGSHMCSWDWKLVLPYVCTCACVCVCMCVCTRAPASPARSRRCAGVTRLRPGCHWGQGRTGREVWRGLCGSQWCWLKEECGVGTEPLWGSEEARAGGWGAVRKQMGCRRSPLATGELHGSDKVTSLGPSPPAYCAEAQMHLKWATECVVPY